ncbi:hypothetical protein [Paenibacillus sp. P32E]|uniref:hypothetical protein n=1 Tax=Paenibacillus sp. P32E TaxID=1349434 RepID=UPI00093C5D02|nr:hypothetical protein [Paenibacillus sp. P32E]OKP88992.1 hypothetical protein A3848_17110 [Paenibacillus sp. P32E]
MNYYQSGYNFPYPTYPAQTAYPQTSESNYSPRDNTFSTRRIQFDAAGADGNNLDVFIITNSLEQPIVTLADKNGFPYVRDFYAKAIEHHGYKGIRLTLRFEGAARGGRGFAVNIALPGMNGNFAVFPIS